MTNEYELKLEPHPTVTDSDTIKRGVFFYTKKEASDFATSIGWPRNSARRIMLPFGRVRFAVSDSHNNILVNVPKPNGWTKDGQISGDYLEAGRDPDLPRPTMQDIQERLEEFHKRDRAHEE